VKKAISSEAIHCHTPGAWDHVKPLEAGTPRCLRGGGCWEPRTGKSIVDSIM